MTIKKLIELLAKLPPDSLVAAWDADSRNYEEVTGVLWAEDGKSALIQTDEL